MNLAVINTKTHQVNVFDGKKLVQSNTFSRALDKEETEDFRKDPKGFLGNVQEAQEEEVSA